MKLKKAFITFGLPAISVIALILFWAIAAEIAGSKYILPTPAETVAALGDLFASAGFYTAFFGTLLRTAIAFLISYTLAVCITAASYKSAAARNIFKPIISVIRALPTIAVVLLLLVWTNSRVAPMIVTMLVVFPTLYNNLYAALCGIDDELTEMCASFNVPKGKTFKKVIFPQISSEFISAAGAGLTLNLKLMVAAEVLSQTARSLGFMLSTSKAYFETAEMIALVLITVVTGLLVEGVFGVIAKKAGGVK